MATHSSVLAWRIPGMGEPGGLPSMGSHRVGHDWSNLASNSSLHSQQVTTWNFTIKSWNSLDQRLPLNANTLLYGTHPALPFFCSLIKCSYQTLSRDQILIRRRMEILVLKRNEFESVVVRWMNLEPFRQREVNLKEKNKYQILMHIYGI